MLKLAINYKEQLQKQYRNIWLEEKFKYYGNCDDIEIANGISECHQFVSVDNNDNVVGFIGYRIDKTTNSIYHLGAINFTENKLVFGKDLYVALTNVFKKYNFRKITFSVIVGNPIEPQYDKLINKLGGRIIGVFKEDVMLHDGLLYDLKLYEIFKDDYIDTKKRRHAKNGVLLCARETLLWEKLQV